MRHHLALVNDGGSVQSANKKNNLRRLNPTEFTAKLRVCARAIASIFRYIESTVSCSQSNITKARIVEAVLCHDLPGSSHNVCCEMSQQTLASRISNAPSQAICILSSVIERNVNLRNTNRR